MLYLIQEKEGQPKLRKLNNEVNIFVKEELINGQKKYIVQDINTTLADLTVECSNGELENVGDNLYLLDLDAENNIKRIYDTNAEKWIESEYSYLKIEVYSEIVLITDLDQKNEIKRIYDVKRKKWIKSANGYLFACEMSGTLLIQEFTRDSHPGQIYIDRIYYYQKQEWLTRKYDKLAAVIFGGRLFLKDYHCDDIKRVFDFETNEWIETKHENLELELIGTDVYLKDRLICGPQTIYSFTTGKLFETQYTYLAFEYADSNYFLSDVEGADSNKRIYDFKSEIWFYADGKNLSIEKVGENIKISIYGNNNSITLP